MTGINRAEPQQNCEELSHKLPLRCPTHYSLTCMKLRTHSIKLHVPKLVATHRILAQFAAAAFLGLQSVLWRFQSSRWHVFPQ